MDVNSLPAVMVPFSILVIPFIVILILYKYIESEIEKKR